MDCGNPLMACCNLYAIHQTSTSGISKRYHIDTCSCVLYIACVVLFRGIAYEALVNSIEKALMNSIKQTLVITFGQR